MMRLQSRIEEFSIDEFGEEGRTLENDIEKEEKFFRTGKRDAQDGFVHKRVLTHAASQKIVQTILERFVQQKSPKCMEFGSGMYGTFYNLFLPERLRRCWTQYDINQYYNKHNRAFTRKYFEHFYSRRARIEEGNIYDMPIDDASVDLIVGLAAWDSIGNFHKAIAEVKRCLHPGGYFMHFQDILPADAPLLIIEAKKREQQQQVPVFPIELTTIRWNPIPGWYQSKEYVTGLASIEHEERIMKIGEYLTAYLGKVCAEKGFGVVLCDKMREEVVQKREDHRKLYEKLGIRCDDKNNIFETGAGSMREEYDESLTFVRKDEVKVCSSIDVLVAQKCA